MMHALLLAIELTWRPAISPLKIAALAALLAALAIWAYGRGLRGNPLRGGLLMVMRLLAVAALALLLMGPSIVPPHNRAPARAKLLILLDTSGSMLTRDCDEQTRIEFAIQRWLTPGKLDALRAGFDLRLLAFDHTARSLGTAALRSPLDLATGRASHYADTLTAALMEQSPEPDGSMILVIGDGHDTDQSPLQQPIAVAKQRGVAVHAVAVGGTRTGRDLAVVALPRQDYLMPQESGAILVRLYQVGLDNQTVTLRMKRGSEQLERQVNLGGQSSVSLELPIKGGEPGLAEYSVWVDPLEGETVQSNNRQSVFVDVSERPMNVLVLEGEPFWDTKFLAQSLRGDPRVKVTMMAQVSAGKQERIVSRQGDSPAQPLRVPRNAAGFAPYDVVVLGRGVENLLDADGLAGLRDYVSEMGGHLILSRGRAYDPDTPSGRAAGEALAVLEPVTWAAGESDGVNQPLHTTPTGKASPVFSFSGFGGDSDQVLGELPGLASMPRVDRIKPATRVLATSGAEGPPAVVTMEYGRGEVLAVLGEGLWRWGLLPPPLKHYRGAYDAMWSNAVRSLALGGEFQPGQQVAMKLSRSSVRLGDPLSIDVASKIDPPGGFRPTLRLLDPDGVERAVPLDPQAGLSTRQQASLTPEKPGVWTAILDAAPLIPATQQKRFSVYDVNIERLRTEARPHLLRELAEQTGGLFFTADQQPDLPALLARQQAARLAPPSSQYAWDTAWILALLLAWLGIEWIGRRQAGWL